MKTKSFAVRSLDHYPSLPDEANERFVSGLRSRHCDPQYDSDYADVEIVPDTFDEKDVPHKKRHCLGTSETSRGRSEPLDVCIVCGISDKWVSRCSGIDCLLSFHGECLNAELGGNEDLPNTYCPYCLFQNFALKCKSAREKAIVAEKTVFKYVDKEVKSRYEAKESVRKYQQDTSLSGDENGNQEHSVDNTDIVSDDQELQGQENVYSSSKEEQVQVEKNSDKSRGKKLPLIEETDQPVGTDKSGDMKEDKVIEEVEASEDEERVATESFQDAEDDNDETANNQTKVKTGTCKNGVVSPFISMQESFSGKEDDQVQQNEKRRTRRRLILNDTDSEISSNESTNEWNGKDVTEQRTSSAQVTSPSRKMKNQKRKLNTTTKVAKSKTVGKISFFKKDQRRRLLWTSQEEEMLKEGVEKFAAEANKNMPWRKILEMGENVFHETRTPADLKDKWRNMIGKRLGQKSNNEEH